MNSNTGHLRILSLDRRNVADNIVNHECCNPLSFHSMKQASTEFLDLLIALPPALVLHLMGPSTVPFAVAVIEWPNGFLVIRPSNIAKHVIDELAKEQVRGCATGFRFNVKLGLFSCSLTPIEHDSLEGEEAIRSYWIQNSFIKYGWLPLGENIGLLKGARQLVVQLAFETMSNSGLYSCSLTPKKQDSLSGRRPYAQTGSKFFKQYGRQPLGENIGILKSASSFIIFFVVCLSRIIIVFSGIVVYCLRMPPLCDVYFYVMACFAFR
ncbi:hypothetical protein Tco_1182111 [Tanacetum coccineum]